MMRVTSDISRTISELEAQLDYERIRRERLEAQLDEYRREMAFFSQQMDDDYYASGSKVRLSSPRQCDVLSIIK